MLSKSQVSFIKSLHQKKFRKQHGLFIVEGIKSVNDFLASGFHFHSIYFTAQFAGSFPGLPANIKLFEVNNAEIDNISTLQTPQGVLGIAHIPANAAPTTAKLKKKFTLLLDGIQDPGNLGTIIRTADWFGISHVICSEDTAEAFNPKTVQATMGSLARISVFYTDLEQFISKHQIAVFGAYLNGENIYQSSWGNEGFILLGNEGKGISEKLEPLVSRKITIPRAGGAESLNVAISAGVFCSEAFRGDLSR